MDVPVVRSPAEAGAGVRGGSPRQEASLVRRLVFAAVTVGFVLPVFVAGMVDVLLPDPCAGEAYCYTGVPVWVWGD